MSVYVDPRIGTDLAGYRIEGLVGRGGMGVVYRAVQTRLERQVALKILAPELAHDASFRERFERESHLAASIDHPNIIPIYEAGEAEGVLFIAMRFVEGIDLKARLEQEQRMQPEPTLNVLGQVAAALDTAHAKGLIHRDIKPGNIVIASGIDVHGSDHVYLTDFGIAKHAASRAGLTRTGHFVGTLDYAAPEQIEGRSLDGRADVYALGCVLYQCLTGKLPFERDSEVAVLYAHLIEPPPTLSAVRPDLPLELDPVITKTMAKRPDERYGSAREFVAAARSALAAAAPAAGHVTAEPAERSRGLLRRLRRGSASAPAVAAAAGTAAVASEQLVSTAGTVAPAPELPASAAGPVAPADTDGLVEQPAAPPTSPPEPEPLEATAAGATAAGATAISEPSSQLPAEPTLTGAPTGDSATPVPETQSGTGMPGLAAGATLAGAAMAGAAAAAEPTILGGSGPTTAGGLEAGEAAGETLIGEEALASGGETVFAEPEPAGGETVFAETGQVASEVVPVEPDAPATDDWLSEETATVLRDTGGRETIIAQGEAIAEEEHREAVGAVPTAIAGAAAAATAAGAASAGATHAAASGEATVPPAPVPSVAEPGRPRRRLIILLAAVAAVVAGVIVAVVIAMGGGDETTSPPATTPSLPPTTPEPPAQEPTTPTTPTTPAEPPSITSSSLPDATVGEAYSATLTASGGTEPYAWSVVSGDLPDGVTLGEDGLLSGTPTAEASSTFTAQVTDAAGETATLDLSIAVALTPVVFTEEQQLLRSQARPDLRSSCTPLAAGDVPGRAVAGIACGEGGPVSVSYYLFPSAETMNAYKGALRPESIPADTGTCSPENPTAENEYLKDGNVIGRMLCYEPDGRPRLTWTTADANIVSTVFRTDTDEIGPLLTWWEVPGFKQAVDPVVEPPSVEPPSVTPPSVPPPSVTPPQQPPPIIQQ